MTSRNAAKALCQTQRNAAKALCQKAGSVSFVLHAATAIVWRPQQTLRIVHEAEAVNLRGVMAQVKTVTVR